MFRRSSIVIALSSAALAAVAAFSSAPAAWSQDDPPTSSPQLGAAQVEVAASGATRGRTEVKGGTKMHKGSTTCASDLYELDDAPGNCTHGPDTAGDLVHDIGSPPMAVTGQPWPCIGTGTDGMRVQALYVRQVNTTSHLTTYLSQFQNIARKVEGVYDQSAAQTGGSRFVRFVTSSPKSGTCSLSILSVTVSAASMGDFGTLTAALAKARYNLSTRHYLIWLDGGSAYCGIGNLYGDDSPGSTNLNAKGPLYASVTNQCWDYAEPHEVMHNLGGVQNSAPHSTGGYHCRDQHDFMCYADAGGGATVNGLSMLLNCPNHSPWMFDCGDDDYYNTAPPAGSYLSTHWNTANSPFLLVGAPPPATITTAATSTSSTTAATTSTVASVTSAPSVTAAPSVTTAATVTTKAATTTTQKPVSTSTMQPTTTVARVPAAPVTTTQGATTTSPATTTTSPATTTTSPATTTSPVAALLLQMVSGSKTSKGT